MGLKGEPYRGFFSLPVRDRLRTVLDERRWREYARTSTSIYYHWQPQLERRP